MTASQLSKTAMVSARLALEVMILVKRMHAQRDPLVTPTVQYAYMRLHGLLRLMVWDASCVTDISD